MDKIGLRKSFEVGNHWPLWRRWKTKMTTQNRQKSNAKKQQQNLISSNLRSIEWLQNGIYLFLNSVMNLITYYFHFKGPSNDLNVKFANNWSVYIKMRYIKATLFLSVKTGWQFGTCFNFLVKLLHWLTKRIKFYR